MNLLFDLPSQPLPTGTSVTVVQAKLRLFKLSKGNHTVPVPPICAHATPFPDSPDTAPGAAPAAAPGAAPAAAPGAAPAGVIPLQALLGLAPAEDRQMRVSVYWYTRSLKKNRGKLIHSLSV